MKKILVSILLVLNIFITITKAASVFQVNQQMIHFTNDGGISFVRVTMNGKQWTCSSNQEWCNISKKTSTKPIDQIVVSVHANGNNQSRSAQLLFVMDSTDTIRVLVLQTIKPSIYPNYCKAIPADSSQMQSDAKKLASKIFAGWNLGNSLEVPQSETAWGNPKVTQRLIDSVKASGINAVRIPCAWDSYIDDENSCKISKWWFSRVKEVVDYCYKNNMYVILNIHWDGGWLENNPTYEKKDSVNDKQKALWEQIAMFFRDYDEHLLFAGTNEVHCNGQASAENFEVQMSFNQTFIDAVRSTGGRNSYRNLIIQSFNTNIDQAISNLIVSKDEIPNRMMVEVHYYDPWDFCGLENDASWATAKKFWGKDFAQYGAVSSWGQEDHAITQFQKMKTNFVDKGYPVILGEYGACRRSALAGKMLEHHLASRAFFFQYIAEQAKNYGIVPFIWDNGSTQNMGNAIFNRYDGSTFDGQVLKAYLTGAKAGKYPY
jgi:endoglucanase